MANDGGNTTPRIDRAEHIGPNDTGDNVEAKRVAPYDWNGTTWTRHSSPLFTKPYDRLIITYTDSTKTVIATIVSKLSGTTQETITNNSDATTDDLVRT